jgi:heme oxygenase
VRQLSPTLLRLNVETASYHARADAVWLDLMGLTATVRIADYVATLERVYGFEAPLEGATAYVAQLDDLVDMRRRCRSGLIAQDLLQLGAKPWELATLPQCKIAPFASVADAMGWLYVQERFTLLHHGIARRLQLLVPDLRDATTYLRAYEGDVGMYWDELGGALDRVACSVEIEDRIVCAAHDAFATVFDWFVLDEKQRAS